jgi:hypothetical protein
MASNDPGPKKPELPDQGPVALLERIVRLPASNDQTPLRIACLLVLACVLGMTPMPFQVIGILTLVVLALSYGHLRK